MSCIECGCKLDDIEFTYCKVSMCTMPVCINCAVIHGLKEAFQKYPKSDKSKNVFLNNALELYKILQLKENKLQIEVKN